MRIETQAGLSPAQYEQVVRLQRECEADSGLDLKLELARADGRSSDNTLLAYAGNELAGYCGIDYGADAEVCGMVHPDHRRHGIGSALLEGVLGAASRTGRESVLVICEDASPIALDWMRRGGATVHMSEHRMVLDLDPTASPATSSVRLRPAVAADRSELVELLSDAFNPASVGERLDRAHPSPGEETMLAFDAETLIGTTRLDTAARRTMIYGFVVVPALRGRGYGRSMMQAALKLLRERRVTEVGLEVEPENVAAVRLYLSFGFQVRTTYRYLRLNVDADQT